MADELRAVGRLLARGGRRALCTVAGFALVLLGLAGLVLPVLPGWALIIAGFAVLGREYTWARRALEFARGQAARSGAGLRTVLRRGRARRGGRPARPEEWPAEVVLASDDVAIELTESPVFAVARAEVRGEQPARTR